MKPNRARFGQRHVLWFTCPACGKHSYDTKGDARAALKRLKSQGRGGMNVYECTKGGTGWHVGHLPAAIKAGKITRQTVYGWKEDRA